MPLPIPSINKQTPIRTSNTARMCMRLGAVIFFSLVSPAHCSYFIDIRYQYRRIYIAMMWCPTTHQTFRFWIFSPTIFARRVRWCWLFIYSLTFRSLFLVVQKLIGNIHRRCLCKQTDSNDVSSTQTHTIHTVIVEQSSKMHFSSPATTDCVELPSSRFISRFEICQPD